jgi:molecular chaperone GrpE (heat shock protein)
MVSKYNMGVEQSLHFRMQLEKRYQVARLNLYEQENSENSQNLYNEWNENFGHRQSLEDEFLKWMSRNHRSEVQAMFGNMTKEEIAHINWSEPKWKWWAINNAQEFSRQYNLSFNDLRYLVNSANRMSVRIPVFFDFVNTPKSIYDTLTEADQAANSAYQKYQRLQERLNQLRSQGKQKTKEYTDTEKEATDALKEYNEEIAKGGKSKSAEAAASKRANAANKANAKARRQQAKAESELQKALRDELQVIDKVQAAYKKLTKAGVSRYEALSIATSGFESTAKNINNVLKKYGIAQFDIKKFAGLSNPREMLKMLEDSKNLEYCENSVKILSSLSNENIEEINKLADELV